MFLACRDIIRLDQHDPPCPPRHGIRTANYRMLAQRQHPRNPRAMVTPGLPRHTIPADGPRIEPVSIAPGRQPATSTTTRRLRLTATITPSNHRPPLLGAQVIPHLPAPAPRGASWDWYTSHPAFRPRPSMNRARSRRAVPRMFLATLQAPEIWAYSPPSTPSVLCRCRAHERPASQDPASPRPS